MNKLNNMIDHEFFNFIGSEANILELLVNLKSIPLKKKCLGCKREMNIIKAMKYNISHGWYCTSCKKYINILSDCDLKDTKISPFVFFKFAYYFFCRVHFSAEYILKNCQIDDKMYKRLLDLFRRKIFIFNEKNRRQLGGFVKEVQIDETYWAKAKYGYKRWGKGIWI
ncbi:hypothetical protein DMUE_5646 [Dictyocoela muelleri]|nr:hypothetical protein DMUE_5646 [Dictyocoela muelleri]